MMSEEVKAFIFLTSVLSFVAASLWWTICCYRAGEQRRAWRKMIHTLNYAKLSAGDYNTLDYEGPGGIGFERSVWRLFTFRKLCK